MISLNYNINHETPCNYSLMVGGCWNLASLYVKCDPAAVVYAIAGPHNRIGAGSKEVEAQQGELCYPQAVEGEA